MNERFTNSTKDLTSLLTTSNESNKISNEGDVIRVYVDGKGSILRIVFPFDEEYKLTPKFPVKSLTISNLKDEKTLDDRLYSNQTQDLNERELSNEISNEINKTDFISSNLNYTDSSNISVLSRVRDFLGKTGRGLILGGLLGLSCLSISLSGCKGVGLNVSNPYLTDVPISQLPTRWSLNVPYVSQPKDYGWCLLASTEMITRYYNRPDITQYVMAPVVFDINPYLDHPQSTNRWENYDNFLKSKGFDVYRGYYYYNRIKWFISKNHPVIISVRFSKGDHAIVVRSYDELFRLFECYDPSPQVGHRDQPYRYENLVKYSTSDYPDKYIYGILIKPKDKGSVLSSSFYEPDIKCDIPLDF